MRAVVAAILTKTVSVLAKVVSGFVFKIFVKTLPLTGSLLMLFLMAALIGHGVILITPRVNLANQQRPVTLRIF